MSLHLKWKTWLLSNFEVSNGKMTSVKDILSLAVKVKENMPSEGSSSLFGKLVQQLWGNQVRLVRKGPHKNRQHFYTNLGCRKLSPADCTNHIPERKNWNFIKNGIQDFSFVKLEVYHYKSQRVSTEVRVVVTDVKNGTARFSLKSHGIHCNLNDVLGLNYIWSEQLALKDKIVIILSLVESSKHCRGIEVDVCADKTQLPHDTGSYSDGSMANTEQRAFSSNCILLCYGNYCSSCQELMRIMKQGKKRRSEKSSELPHPCTNKRHLTKENVLQQYETEKKRRKSTENREKYWRQKFYSQSLEMSNEDHDDLTKIFQNHTSKTDVPDEMVELWNQQKLILECKSSNAYRWHPKIMRLCLDLYSKNPHVLDPLREFLILPSNKTIRLHKNKIKESTGWNDDVLQWCLDAAKQSNMKEENYYGGFIIDEMKIQENLEMAVVGGKHRLVGFANLGEGHDLMRKLSGHGDDLEIATHVLQFVFLSDGGFRFPIAQWPSASCTPSDLYHLFWEGVLRMLEFGFNIYWCVLDGADCNRQFIQSHFKGKDPVAENFTTFNVNTGEPMIFIMDPKHNIKKIRNNILKSNFAESPRCLKVGGKAIVWKHFKQAYEWDQDSFSLPLHEKLTPQHMDLDAASKMRNKLAEDVLDSKMLFLMEKYQECVKKKLDAVISLLSHTSKLISLFNDRLYITSPHDQRLTALSKFYIWMSNWSKECKGKEKNFISSKLWFDLKCMCLGFQSLVQFKLSKFPGSVIKPGIINQDCVENHFCQVRSCNGQNNNPTFLQQQAAQNSIRLGQTLISRKSNASCNSTSTHGVLSSKAIPKKL